MKLGAENKKALYALVLLGGGALYGVYNAFFAGPDIPKSSSSTASAAVRPADPPASPLSAAADAAAAAQPKRSHRPMGNTDKFSPVIVSKNPEDRPDLASIDPTLRLDLLAKVDEVPAPAGTHNLFQVGPPPPKVELKGPEPVVKVNLWARYPPPIPTPTPPPGPKPPPQPVPINVKYYGWVQPSGTNRRTAFFLDGDDIIKKSEGEAIKGHYKVVHIDATHVVIEDMNDKLQQTLTKVEEGA